jgi:hypothetical protein
MIALDPGLVSAVFSGTSGLAVKAVITGAEALTQTRGSAAAATSGDDLQLSLVSRTINGKASIMQSPWTRAGMDVASAAYTGIPMALGKTGFVSGGARPWLSQGFAGVTAVTGTISLYNDLKTTTKRPAWARGLVIAGGYMAATGSFIGAFGGILPGACIAAIGSGLRAIGLIGYGLQDKKARKAA